MNRIPATGRLASEVIKVEPEGVYVVKGRVPRIGVEVRSCLYGVFGDEVTLSLKTKRLLGRGPCPQRSYA